MARIGGYPKLIDGRWALTDWHGKSISSSGQRVGCTKIRPGARGSWISSERCSYRFKVNGNWYSCRGYGEGMSTSCRLIKNPRKLGLQGAKNRRRR